MRLCPSETNAALSSVPQGGQPLRRRHRHQGVHGAVRGRLVLLLQPEEALVEGRWRRTQLQRRQEAAGGADCREDWWVEDLCDLEVPTAGIR